MKRVENGKYITVRERTFDGGNGVIRLPRSNKIGHITASIVWSVGGGWDHVSVCPRNGAVPTWADMCLIKDLFFDPEDWVVQFHPAASEYVNLMPNCLHLWRPTRETLPTPPRLFV